MFLRVGIRKYRGESVQIGKILYAIDGLDRLQLSQYVLIGNPGGGNNRVSASPAEDRVRTIARGGLINEIDTDLENLHILKGAPAARDPGAGRHSKSIAKNGFVGLL